MDSDTKGSENSTKKEGTFLAVAESNIQEFKRREPQFWD
jgi:hypothetical protein